MTSYFKFTPKQRNGIFLLIISILGLGAVDFFVSTDKALFNTETPEIEAFRKEIDSLKFLKLENSKPKLYPFNPNFISDFKGYTLGMSNEEIDKLIAYRKKGKWINSAKQFQNVTEISDSLLQKISPYFKFPEWVSNPKNKIKSNSYKNKIIKSLEEKIDLNKATVSQLQNVYGVGEKLSQRIINYREKYNGFIADVELSEVYGLSPEVIMSIKEQFAVKSPRHISKLNLNQATKDQLVTIPYIDYEVASYIIEERILREGFKSIEDLTKVEQFPQKKIEIIKLYLYL